MPATTTTTEYVFDAERIDEILTKLIEHENDESCLTPAEAAEIRHFDACIARAEGAECEAENAPY